MKQQSVFSFLSLCVGILLFYEMSPSSQPIRDTPSVSARFFGNPKADDSTYIKELQAWHQARMAGLKAESGWLNLAGLFWLKEGANTFGSDKTNTIVFPKGAGLIGQLTLNNGEVTVEIDSKAQVTVNQEPITTLKLFPTEKNKPE